jgi:hypothetical protein
MPCNKKTINEDETLAFDFQLSWIVALFMCHATPLLLPYNFIIPQNKKTTV